jgi:hypothetical protein
MNLSDGAIPASRLQVSNLYKIRRSDDANPGSFKMVPFEYMGSDANPYPLKFRYLETDEIVRYQAAHPSYPNAVIREGANGPTYIYPYEETLRNAALRSVPQGTIYDPGTNPEPPPTVADPYSRGIAKDIRNSVRKESEQLGGKGRRRRKTRKSKKRSRKTRRR